MDAGLEDLMPECLRRSDIAAFLDVSLKQAGRLIVQMPSFMVGKSHRRVLRTDFEAWIAKEKRDLGGQNLQTPDLGTLRATVSVTRRVRSAQSLSASTARSSVAALAGSKRIKLPLL